MQVITICKLSKGKLSMRISAIFFIMKLNERQIINENKWKTKSY